MEINCSFRCCVSLANEIASVNVVIYLENIFDHTKQIPRNILYLGAANRF